MRPPAHTPLPARSAACSPFRLSYARGFISLSRPLFSLFFPLSTPPHPRSHVLFTTSHSFVNRSAFRLASVIAPYTPFNTLTSYKPHRSTSSKLDALYPTNLHGDDLDSTISTIDRQTLSPIIISARYLPTLDRAKRKVVDCRVIFFDNSDTL